MIQVLSRRQFGYSGNPFTTFLLKKGKEEGTAIGLKGLQSSLLLLVLCLTTVLATAQAPAISSFSPTSGPVGIAVTINGSGFSTTPANNIVYFGAVKATVTAASATTLTATVPAGASYQPITVTTGNLTAYASRPFIITFPSASSGFGDSTFAAKLDYTAGSGPYGVATSDLDGDGKIDMVVVNLSSSTVSTYKNTGSNGNISFAAKVDYATGSGPYSVAIGDLDGDGKPDIATANSSSNSVSVLRNTSIGGNISFAAKVDYTTGSSPYKLAIGDIDKDGRPDIVAANYSSSTASVLLNASTVGVVSFAAKVDYTTGSGPLAVVVSDLDRDGKSDIAVANAGSNTVSLLKNTSTGGTVSFATKVDYTVGSFPYSIVAGDVDGDDKPDLATANYSSTTVSVLRNTSTTGSISYAAKVDYTTANNPINIAIGDMNGDGKPDLAVTNYSSSTVSILRNTGSSGTVSFSAKVDYVTGSSPASVAIGDLDGNSKPDLAIVSYGNNNVSVLKNQTDAPYINSFAPADAPVGATVTIRGGNLTGATAVGFGGIAASSFTVVSDTVITAVVATMAGGSVNVTSPNGTGTLRGFYNGPVVASFSPATGAVGSMVTVTGINFNATAANNTVFFGAVKATVTAASTTSLTATVPAGSTYQPLTVTNNGLTSSAGQPFNVTFPSNPAGVTASSFTPKADFATGSSPYSVATGDLDGDGKPDVVSVNAGSYTISVFRNTSTGGTVSFATAIGYNTGSAPQGVAIGDVDGDGKPDVVVSNASSNSVSVFRNTSTGSTISFATRLDFTTGSRPYGIAISDVDADGKPDLVVANYYDYTVSILKNIANIGTIAFATKVDFSVGIYPSGVDVRDLNSDGKPDIAVANSGTNTVSVLRNTSSNGSPTFATKLDYTTGSSPYSVSIGDVDSDGKPDLAVASYSSNTISVLKNNGTAGAVSFAAKVDFATGGSPYSIAIADVDGDSRPDLATANYGTNTLSVLRNTGGSGTLAFAAKVDYTAGTNPYGIVITDVSGDGKPELINTNSNAATFSVFRNQAAGPNITSFTPVNAAVGATVTLRGSSFTGATAVSFGGVTASSFTVVSDTIITAVVAAGAGGVVAVTTPDGMATLAGFYNGPIITSFAPLSGAIGSSVTLSGSGFSTTAASNTVYFGAVKATVTAATATSLTVTVPIGATYQPITVTNGGFTGYTDKSFSITFPANPAGITINSFAPKTDFTTGNTPYITALTDLNGDGKADVAVVNRSSNTVSVFRNTGTAGTVAYAAKVDYSTGSTPYSIAAGDVDGDGRPDLVVVNANSYTVSVFKNTSTGGTISFATKVDFPTGSSPYSIAVGDIDGDGKPDIATANTGANTISVLRNTSTGGIVSFDVKADFTAGSSPYNIAIGDVNGDGRPDLAVVNANSSTLSIFRNTSASGIIALATRQDYATGGTPYSIAVGDLDGDGKPDLATANYTANSVSVLKNNSTGGTVAFATKVDYATGNYPFNVAISDLDGDGKPEIGATNYYDYTVSVLKNTSGSSTISFASKVDFTTGTNPYGVAIGDMDGDGLPDLLITNSATNGTLSVLRSQANGPNLISFTPSNAVVGSTVTIRGTYFTGATAVSFGGVSAASFTVVSDTVITAVVAAIAGGDVAVTTPNGTARLGGFYNGPVITSFTPASGPVGTTVTLAGSGFNSTSANNVVYFGAVKAVVTSASTTSLTVIVPAGASYQPVTVTNNNLTAYTSQAFLVTFPSAATGFTANSFASRQDFSTGSGPYNVATGDLDGDGKADAVVANYNNSSISVFRNTSSVGSISFATKTDYTAGSSPVSIAIGDIDRDGKLDVAVANFGSSTVSVFRNTSSSGTISFAAKVDYPTGSCQGIAIGDLDGDGKPDLAVTNYYEYTVSVLRNTGGSGTISFAARTDFTSGTYPAGIAIGDFNGDNKPDLAVANYYDYTVSIYQNTGSSGTVAFAPRVSYSTGVYPYGIAVGDLDADGRTDLAIANYNAGTVSLLRNQGSGTISFANRVDYAVGSSCYNIAISDLDGDGKPDITTARIVNPGILSLLKNNSTSGTLSFAAKVDYATGANPYGVALSDLDGDSKPDLMTANYSAATFSAFRNQAAGAGIISFTPANAAVGATVTIRGSSFTGTTAVSLGGVVASSFTVVSDSIITAVVAAVAGGVVSVTTPDGTATLAGFYNGPVITAFTPATGAVGSTVTLTGSGFNTTTGSNTVFFGAVKATVTAATATSLTVTVPVGATYQPITVTNGGYTGYTGKPFTVTFPGNPAGITVNSFVPKVDFATGSSPYGAAVTDLDGDGKADVVVANRNFSTLSLFRNTGSSGTITMATKLDFNTGSTPYSIATGDLDGDGKPDLVVANTSSGTVSIFKNTSSAGNLSLSARIDITIGNSPYAVAVSDVDMDGKPDILVTNSGNYLSVLKNTSSSGTISFAARIDYTTGSTPYSIATGDVDGDGKPDVVVGNAGSNTISVFRNIGASGIISLAAKIDYTAGSTPYGIAIGDMDGDGKPDIATANYNSNTVSLLKNQSSSGTISFATKVDFATGTNPYSVAITDVSGDGQPDVATANYASNTVSILQNISTGSTLSLAAKVDFATGTAPYSVALGDLDGDGKPDLIATNYSSSTFSALRSQADGPNIASFTPTNAPVGTTITIKGTNFTGATAVTLGGVAATSFTVVSDTVITAVVAAISGGSVTVTTPKGTARLGGFFNGPIISSFAPASGPVGTTITISGSGFSGSAGGNTVYFGAVKATVAAASTTSLTVTVPAGATYQPITVTTGGLTGYAGAPFNPTFVSSTVGLSANSFAPKVDFTANAPYSIVTGDIDGDGKPDLVTVNRNANTLSVFTNNGSPGTVSLNAKVDITTASNPFDVAIGDLNGDGKPDLAVVNAGTYTVSVFRNTSTPGTVSFATRVDYATGSYPYDVAIGDVDNDGRPDLAVANYYDNTISIFKNTGNSSTLSFATRVDIAAGSSPTSVAIGDVDGDGKPDLAITSYGSYTISVLRNTGNSDLSFDTQLEYSSGSYPYNVMIGDMDGDGKPDLAVANYNVGTVSTLRNLSTPGAVSFAARTAFTVGGNAYYLDMGDVDGDGKPDLATANNSTTTLSVLRNTSTSGTIAFAAKADYTVGSAPYGIIISDMDGDGKPDLAAAGTSANTVSILRNQADAPPSILFFTPANAAVGATVTITGSNFTGTTSVSLGGVAAASFTVVSDNTITAVVAVTGGGNVTVVTPRGTASLGGFYNGPVITAFSPASGAVGASVTITGSNFGATAVGNIVYFGAVQATVTATSATSLTVTVPVGNTYQPITVTTGGLTAYAGRPFLVTFPSDSAGITSNSFSAKTDFGTGSNPYSTVMADMDGDGKPDLATANYGSGSVSVLRNTGTPGTAAFAGKVDFATGSNPYNAFAADLDGDGKKDLAVANYGANTISVFKNTGSSGTVSFGAKTDYTTGSNPNNIAAADIDGDGRTDLVVVNTSSNTVSVFKNTGNSGTIAFGTKIDFATGSSPRGVAIADVDSDGKPDLVVANAGSYTISILRNIGSSGVVSFATRTDYNTSSYPYDVAVGDIDSDGKPDIAVVNYYSYTVSVIRNFSVPGTLGFATRVDFATGNYPTGVAIGDVDGDGKPDLAIANYNASTISVLGNTSISNTISFAAKVDFAASSYPYNVSIGDVDGDGKPDLAASNYYGNTVSILRNQVSSNTITVGTISTNLCAGNAVAVPFTASDTLNANNQFTAQLSDNTGGFLNPVTIGSLAGTVSDTINAVIPANTPVGTGYRIRVVSSSPVANSLSNAAPLTISQLPASGFNISGPLVTCPVLQTYTATSVSGTGIRYNWVLSGGGTLDTATAGTAKVTWTTAGQYTLSLTLFNSCGNSPTKSIQVAVDSNQLSGSFPNMLPANGNTGLSLPITFSWYPIANAEYYDLYIWPDSTARPATPTVSSINGISYTISSTSILQYEKTYRWQVVARRACYSLLSPEQTFRLRYLPDVIVSSITPATTGFSGQAFSINWQVKNIGQGGTLQGQWYDQVYLSADAILDPSTDIYLGILPNVSELPPNASYSQTATFTLPQGINNNYYVFVTTNVYNGLLESDRNNNTSISAAASAIQLTPPPDLQVASIVPPNFIFSGQDMTFTWRVTNRGTGSTRTAAWTDIFYLSKDSVLNLATATNLGSAYHTGALLVDSSYTSTYTAHLPNGIFGKYYLYVLTDYYNQVYEHTAEGNNTSRSDSINVILTPPVDLIVTQVTATPASLSNRDNLNVQWRVENAGGSSTGGQGWYDNIYLSKDAVFVPASAILVANVYRPTSLNAGDGYSNQYTIAVPGTITGNYYVYVVADGYNYVYEYNLDTNNTRRAASATTVLSPDLVVAGITAPAADSSGHEITLQWRIRNSGPGRLFNTSITDRILISNSAVYNAANSTELKRVTYSTGNLAAGDTVGQTTQVRLPDGISGNYYFFIQTDFTNTAYEGGLDTNNTGRSAAPIAVQLGPWPDLQVAAVQLYSDTAIAGFTIPVSFRIINRGVQTISGLTWSDRLYISALPQWDSLNATLLKTFAQSTTLAKDSAYTINTTLTVPAQFVNGTYYVFVQTDAQRQVYEHTDENNNIGRSARLYVNLYPPVDLVMTATTAPDSAATGTPINVAWTTLNRSTVPTVQTTWNDGLYLSADTLWNRNNDILVKEFTHSGILQAGQSYANQQTVALPNNLFGNYYLMLVADHTDANRDANRTNNYLLKRQGNTPVPLRITLTPPSDLQVTSFTVPYNGQAGQPVTVKWQVKNTGTGITNAKPWTERIYLSTNPVIDVNDIGIGSYVRADSLLPGASYTDSLQVFLPLSVQGNYYVLIKTDVNDNVYEHNAEGNNTANAIITIAKAPISDLIVSGMTVPDSAIAGENLTVQWKLKNIGQFPASGYLRDAVYLSEDTIRDVNDILLVSQQEYINIAPQTEATQSFTGELRGAALKDYYVLVHTDVLNNIYESNDSNNVAPSAKKMVVTVPQLPLNVLTQRSMPDGKEVFYRIEIPDSLAGETLLISLKGDSVNGANELYLRLGQVPTRAVYDYAYGQPYSGNQEITVPALAAGAYYLLVTGSTTAGNTQPISLLAKVLQFEVRSVDATRGGNTGPVTLLLRGSKLNTATNFYLRSGSRSLEAYQVRIIDPTKAYVTFNLKDAITGVYSIVAKSSRGDSTSLPNSFTIVPGTAASLITNVLTPPNTRPSTVISITVQFTNAGNTDILNPVLKLSSLGGAPIAFNPAGLVNNATELTLTLQELNGPTGILRPGASGTVIVYAKATTALGFFLSNTGN